MSDKEKRICADCIFFELNGSYCKHSRANADEKRHRSWFQFCVNKIKFKALKK